ncbi:MAG: hypothetical protein IKO36_10540 [Bacteroidaceae bacterium]|nr:hypothetical protein [Bacteroidaceae bacterium]
MPIITIIESIFIIAAGSFMSYQAMKSLFYILQGSGKAFRETKGFKDKITFIGVRLLMICMYGLPTAAICWYIYYSICRLINIFG